MQTSTLSLATSIPATTRPFCAIIQLPSLLGTGSKPLQLFGLRKTPDLSHAPRQALMAFEHFGLRSSDGRLVRTARSHILANFADTRVRISRNTIARGRPGRPGCTCQNPCAFFHYSLHTVLRAQSAPGLPCALVSRKFGRMCERAVAHQPPVAGTEPAAPKGDRACNRARDSSGVFLNPNSCKGFEPEPSKEGSG